MLPPPNIAETVKNGLIGLVVLIVIAAQAMHVEPSELLKSASAQVSGSAQQAVDGAKAGDNADQSTSSGKTNPGGEAGGSSSKTSGYTAGDFVYTPLNNGYAISGFSDLGKIKNEERKMNVVGFPDTYDGQPILGFSEDAFRYAPIARISHWPNQLEYISDGAFFSVPLQSVAPWPASLYRIERAAFWGHKMADRIPPLASKVSYKDAF